MNVFYDREGDVLHVQFSCSGAPMRTREAGDGVLVHVRADTGEVESIEVWNFSERASVAPGLELPLALDHAAYGIRAVS